VSRSRTRSRTKSRKPRVRVLAVGERAEGPGLGTGPGPVAPVAPGGGHEQGATQEAQRHSHAARLYGVVPQVEAEALPPPRSLRAS
jgi:hypothetical protein